MAKVSRSPFTVIVAARTRDDEKAHVYRVDYAQPSRTSEIRIPRGFEIPSQILSQCTAVGYTAKGSEYVSEDFPNIYWECIGIPPYPGCKFPRVVGIASLADPDSVEAPFIITIRGNALEPRGQGPRIIAQVVNDTTPNWGAGFAKAVANKYPSVQSDFKKWATNDPGNLSLGRTRVSEISSDLCIFSMVCQHGFGPSTSPRIRYAKLRDCLEQLSEYAQSRAASIHIPRIGTGYAGGNWSYIAELIDDTVVRRGNRVTIYVLPGSETPCENGLVNDTSLGHIGSF